jgi:hypothetical protein
MRAFNLLVVFFAVFFAWSGRVVAKVTITDATDEGIACFKIVTDTATYFYDKAGAGFTSMLDKAGTDWINFHPQGSAPNGQSGWYRGIPNMGLNQFGHPGYTGATSTTSDAKGVAHSKVTVKSTKGSWSVTWEFHPTFAMMTVLSVAENYWFLYEGTPGGAVGSDDYSYRSSGAKSQLDKSWQGDITNTSGAAKGTEWIYFADGKVDRSLFMIHNDDSIVDQYYLMDPMTVFGFGRGSGTTRHMSATPATLIIGFIETRDYGTAKGQIDTIHNDATGTTPTLPALRDDCDKTIRDRRKGSATDSDVKAKVKTYRNAK